MRKSTRRALAYSFFIPIIFVLGFLATPPRSQQGGGEKRSALKANIYTLQTMLENYAIQHQGVYPKSLQALEQAAQKEGYWLPFRNPYANEMDSMILFSSDTLEKMNWNDRPEWEGFAIYTPESVKNASIKHYCLYGIEKDGRFLRDRGDILYLHNDGKCISPQNEP